ncbi:MAG TPA: hemerythrin domain-containing protein [Pyrinomonadaceae bacterium]
MNKTRRQLLTSLSFVGAGALLIGCRATPSSTGGATNKEDKEPAPGESVPVEVTATEDLMREHGVLRRALLVYQESAVKLRQDPAGVPAEALEKTAQLFRVFGEDYHEKRLEEDYIIPLIRKVQGPAAGYADVLLAQHARGREITDYLLSVSKADRIATNHVEDVAKTLESFVRMYEHHAAIEDTVVFPAWKAATGEQEYDELGDKFEEIETEQFGGDGFETALKRMEEIETSLGLNNLDMFTAPPPRK